MTTTLVDLLELRASQTPDRLAYTFLIDGEANADQVTYSELNQRVRALASRLQAEGMTGERALLVFPPGLDYITAFFACLYAGVVAVPVYPPQRKRTLPRLLAILADADAKFALTTESMRLTVDRLLQRQSGNQEPDDSSLTRLKNFRWLVTDDSLQETETECHRPNVTDQTVAFLQYTSGSTGTPKGVMVSHGNLIENQRVIQQAFGHTDQTVVVGWLPLYHDMGLIGNVLQPLYIGGQCILMAPHHFLQKPLRWLTAISRYRATTSGGPNFAYDLCVNRITPEQRETLDLSCWNVAFNGAEPIRASTLEKFVKAFKPTGFRRRSMYPCYGMAEATLMVSGGQHTAPPLIKTVWKSALEKHDVSVLNRNSKRRDASKLVGCGQTYTDHQLIIVEPEKSTPCVANRIGELWVKGPSVTQGYWHRQEESDRTFQATLSTGEGPYLRTGDLGFIHDDQVFITGRLKDLMIIRGRNHYPQDLEMTVSQSHSGLRDGGGAVFSIEAEGEERVVVVQEVEHRVHLKPEQVAAAIRSAVAESHEIQVYAVVLIKAGSLPKTSSGKVQRYAARERFLSNELDVIGQSLQGVDQAPDVFVDPCTPIEETLAEIWTEVLDCERVSQDSNFFALGGDSLRGMQVLVRLQEVWRVGLSLEDLFENPTLSELANCIATLQSEDHVSGHASQSISLKSLPPAEHPPLSFAQQRLWFLTELDLDSPFYNIPIALKLTGMLNVSALEWSLQEIMRRHEVLRATFPTVEGKPIQAIAQENELLLGMTDLAMFDEIEQQAAVQQMSTDEAQQAFNLAHGPLVRVKLLHLNEQTHVLLVTMHHIVADGWSMGILVQELRILYEAAVKGQPSPLPSLPIQYADFARWQRVTLNDSVLKESLDYWRKRLQGAPEFLALPTDRPRPVVQRYRGAKQEFVISANLLAAIRDMSQRQGVTMFMTLLAAFKILLARYSGQMDIVVGTPFANRTRIEIEGLIGFFVNTVILRTEMSDDRSFVWLLDQVKETVLGAQAHQAVPFEQVVEAVQPTRVLSHSPLFQVMMAFQNMPLEELTLPDLRVEQLPVDNSAAQFDLSVAFSETNGEISGEWKYNIDLFDHDTIARMATHYQQVLQGGVAKPEARLSELSLLSEAECKQAIIEWNNTQQSYPQEQLIHEFFEVQAAETPEAIAVVCDGHAVTYEDLNCRANVLAHYLRSLGVGPEVLVGICLERSVDMVVGLLGILKAGGAYVPLDPEYPEERLAFMVADAGVAVVLTHETLQSRLPADAATVVCLDTKEAIIREALTTNPNVPIAPENLAYVIYTSGSTGQPKGVGVSHAGLLNLIQWMQEAYSLTANDRLLQKTPFSFDVSVWEFFWPLVTGARLVVAPPGDHRDPERLKTVITTQGVTTLHFVPSMLQAFLESTGFESCQTLRRIFCGGDVLPEQVAEKVLMRLEGVELYHLYGPTEASVDVTAWSCEKGAAEIPIGRPIANTQIYVLDRHGQPVPVGVIGEMQIGGIGLARGYHNRCALTAEKFVPNPFSTVPGARLYKTGDLARYRGDGVIEYVGRIDYQVKLRGFRIELGEIEAQLRAHEQIQDAVVVVHEAQPGNKQLVGYVVPAAGSTLDLRAVKEALVEWLPGYMVPTQLVQLEKLPLTPNGKVDRKALPVHDVHQRVVDGEHVAPQTDIEQAIAIVWHDVLHVRAIGIHDNFFDLGGNSLLIAQVRSKLQNVFDREISLVNLFQYPTIHALAEYLTQLGNGHMARRESHDLVLRVDKGKRRMAQQRARRQKQGLQK